MALTKVEELIAEVARGRMVILVDAEERENEGDFVMAAEKASPSAIQFMATHGRGLICAPLQPDIADRLSLPLMTSDPLDPHDCAFTVSVDARVGTSTGISAFDRAKTVRLLASAGARPADFKRPGHVFPLRARAGGVLERPGHTEAAIDLARLAGLAPAAVICEIMKDDGSMARLPDLEDLARRNDLRVGSIADLIAYRERHSELPVASPPPFGVRQLSSAQLPTPMGVFRIHVFASPREDEIVVLTLGDLGQAKRREEPLLVRVHSACFTGDVLGSLRCDCGGQLQGAMQRIGDAGAGMLIYLPQEGRGIGLARKLEAYRLQEEGLDTVEANLRLGYAPDLRSYDDAAAILHWFGIRKVCLLTNNPAKLEGLAIAGIESIERIPLEAGPGPVNFSYLKAKQGKLGHLFDAI